MLESLAAWVLKYFLGKYVENLNTDQLTIGLLQGEVELENLPLKKEAFRQVGLPVQVTSGFIGKVKLQIPFRQLRTAPWVIIIEKIYLVAAPVDLLEWDEEAEEQALLEQKLSILDAIEAQWRASTDGLDQGYYASSYTSWMNFGTSVVSNIVESLQLNITDVHIRYEDSLTVDSKYFTFGLLIESLVAQSCNESWEPGYSAGESSFKVLELSKLSVYWEDCQPSDFIGAMDVGELINAMGKQSSRGSRFLVNCVSGKAHLKKNRSTEPLRSRSTPRIICDVMFDDFPISLSDKQYAQIIAWQRGLEVLKCQMAMRHLRPVCTVSEDAKKWWRYFLQATIENSRVIQIRNWDLVLKRARDNVAYVHIYEKLFSNPAGLLNEEQKALKDRIEADQSLDELRALRVSAMHRVRPITKPTAPTSTNYLSAWFPQFWYSAEAGEGDAEDKQWMNEELFEALEGPMNEAAYLKRDAVFGQFNFSLKEGTVTLSSAEDEQSSKSLFELQLEKVLLGFEWRPKNASFKVSVTLGAILLKDKLTANSIFPILVAPQGRDVAPSNIDTKRNLTPGLARLVNQNSSNRSSNESLLHLLFELKPPDSNADCKIHVKTQSLDIVYNPGAFGWLMDFFTKPQYGHGPNLRTAARRRYQAIKAATKNELMKNWGDIIAGKLTNRKIWDIDLDISAPQIILVEHFCDENSVIVVVDLGRLHFSNSAQSSQTNLNKKDSEDDEAFQTPCSTPPGSEASPENLTPNGLSLNQLNELSLHAMLYERYVVELGDMQVLVGRVRDNWKFSRLKGTSSLHVLDRFNISMQIERRVVYTCDPQYPSLTFSGNLLRLVVHVNEPKISSLRSMCAIVIGSGQTPPSPQELPLQEDPVEERQDESFSEASRLIIMQFTVHHLALEVQSRNRSVAELQVSGVQLACTRRQFDTSVTLTVHSLLLVDAMQTFGRDFELLVASHKHVGMDSLSGSLRDSEPCSPTSPGSPEPGDGSASPVAINQALADLDGMISPKSGIFLPTSPLPINSPPPGTVTRPLLTDLPDSEALILVELTFISGSCPGHDGQPLQIADLQFNNLDVIANQETIVELLGFAQRVFPPTKSLPPRVPPLPSEDFYKKPCETPSEETTVRTQLPTRTEATFDFHRLNILLLRASIKDGVSIGRKICTATMMEAKIKASVGEGVMVEGSLGGIQILDLTPEGARHQRILSLGADPLAPSDSFAQLSAGLYQNMTTVSDESAFSFCVRRSLQPLLSDCVDVKIRLASVWYTHSPILLRELQSCATEFKQYLKNLARSIRSAATEVAMGIVHARAEALALSLSMSSRIYGGSNPDVSSPRKRRKSFTQSMENMVNTPYTPYAPHTPWSPEDEEFFDTITFKLDVVLDSPVIVLPKSATSDHVFVAHLGKITLRNSYPEREAPWESRIEKYHIDVRDVNLHSVVAAPQSTNISLSASGDAILPRPEKMYSHSNGKPILHDTVIDLAVERTVCSLPPVSGSWDFNLDGPSDRSQKIQLTGGVVGPLKVSLSREQYQQVLETSEYLLTTWSQVPEEDTYQASKRLGDIEEEESATEKPFTMDLSIKPRAPISKTNLVAHSNISLGVIFEVPEFTVELLAELGVPREGGLVSVSFRDFMLNFERPDSTSTYLQMSLKSLVMEDLLVPEGSKNRFLVVSSAAPTACNRRFTLSQSCPSLSRCPILVPEHNSLPDNLASTIYFGKPPSGRRSYRKENPFGLQEADRCAPCTPPPSPRPGRPAAPAMTREENLVLICIDTSENSKTGQDRNISVDFNCLDVIANIQSWVVIFDFLGIGAADKSKKDPSYETRSSVKNEAPINLRSSKMDLQVRSLTLILVRPEYEVCKANISHLTIKTHSAGQFNLEGRLGSMSLMDLSPHGKLYRERFLTSGKEALHVRYVRHGRRSDNDRSCDSELSIEMSSVIYVHTQRFLNEIYAYFHRFSQLQTLMSAMHSSGSEKDDLKPSSRLLLSISAGSPVLILPVASASPEVLVADLGELTVRNGFRRAGSVGTIANTSPEGTTSVRCLLDVMSVELLNMDLFTGNRILSGPEEDILKFGGLRIRREGPSLLPNKCHLKLQVDRNLDTHLSREVPDITVKGTLTKLEAFLDLAQYKIIRGLLAYNIGENLQDLAYNAPEEEQVIGVDENNPVWMSLSIHLDLVNVLVHLREKHGQGAALACVNFIKSRLAVDSFSDRSQDIDLVSAEILITDTRYLDEPMNERSNVFTNILQPLGLKMSPRGNKKLEKKPSQESEEGAVQAEIHHRRRKEYSKATVLLHNMRLMAVLDWWETARDFIAQKLEEPNRFEESKITDTQVIDDSASVPFEFKLNVTDSEIVLVENTSAWDTNAIILKSTTVITYRPNMVEKPLSCNLNHCELFSCLLGMEEETALSIIDPVTVNLEVRLLHTVRGISDAVLTSDDRTLDISLHSLNVRLSYHDFRMLSRMLESVPRQTRQARNNAFQHVGQPPNVKNQIAKLSALGFSAEDCAGALEQCNGELNDAAWLLTQNDSRLKPDSSSVSFNSVEVKLGCLSIVVIDDCRDADVPLLEFCLSSFNLKKILNGEGVAMFSFNCDYYNRVLSGWEPFIETWQANLKWEQALTAGLSRNRLQLDIISDKLMNINITSTLMDLYKMVKDSWTEDYCDQTPARAAVADEKGMAALHVRRRLPFVPFAMKNETGCQLWFTTLIKTGNNISEQIANEENWVLVNPDETVPLTFEGREKSRHRDTHKVRVHQVVVRVGIWTAVNPVSIDKVGVVFRHVPPLSEYMYISIPPVRVVFAITLEGTARKLVTVRSALILNNTLTEAVEAKLENTFSNTGVWEDTIRLEIPATTSVAIPISHAHANIWIRPCDSEKGYHAFSTSTLGWTKAKKSKDLIYEVHQCPSNRDKSYRFVAAIYHEDMKDSFVTLWRQPAHTISLYSPVVITNLLPCDLHYSLHQTSIRGHVKPGLSANIHQVDYEQRIELKLHIDGFGKKASIAILAPGASFRSDIRVHDDNDRPLLLNVAVDYYQRAGVAISVSAPFWVVNKTSIPLVVRQQSSSQDAAGQGPETEVARVVTPLLFSLADPEAGPMAQLRVGNSHLPDSQPQWCHPFALQVGTLAIRLRVAQKDRSDFVYIIGIHIRNGKGRHRRTKIITLSPRFNLQNKSSYQLQFSLQCLATTLRDPAASATYGTAVQESSLAWNWPRLDKELLLCVRILSVVDCLWSGGFTIDNDDSFHVNVRDIHGKIYFLRAEIVLQDATYFTVFTDADNMPSPFRIDNCALVPIEFFQADSKIDTARSQVRPQSSMPYAWDLPRGQTRLTVVAPGGSTASFEVHTSNSEPNAYLTYENFIYIAFSATFKNGDIQNGSTGYEPLDVESQELVLDCVDGRKVVLNRMQQGQRSQLWCMTSDGQLQHEGSSPPKDPKSKSFRSNSTTMVLDIIATAPQPSQCVSLILRRPDQRRASTQTWRFTEDGRLRCAHNNMCVQAKDGFFGLRQGSRAWGGKWEMWSEAVLGPKTDTPRTGSLPAEQAVSRKKMRPGSGYLVVRVGSDGPTRVLRICDLKDAKSLENEWTANVQLEETAPSQRELQLNVKLTSGLGVSVVSRTPPEELLYIHLKGINLNVSQTSAQSIFECHIENLQADNQLFEAKCPVVLNVIQPYRDDEPVTPAVTILAHKQHSLSTNAHIFKHFIVSVKKLSLCIEELLLLKLCAMFGPVPDIGTEHAEESDFETQRRVMEATSVHADRYYFGILQLKLNQIRLSVATSPKLTPQLQRMKKKLGLGLIKFEDAAVDLKEFERIHPFETSQCLWGSIVKHFKTELTWQAAAILGTVDFLGNPLGLINDVSEGVATLFYEGNVGALVKSVTHGLSNSAAKVTESISDGLGRVVLDESHEETRQRIRKVHSGSSQDHLWAGVKGFGFGVLGGVTSIFKQTYDGGAHEGIPGMFAGFGKGLVGTVTKPMIGFLDLASETASALRDSSRTSDRSKRCRLPRLVHGPGGLMPIYSESQAFGQDFLYNINNQDYAEKLVAFEILSKVEDLGILISNEQVLLCTSAVQVAQYHLSSLSHSKPVSKEDPATGAVLHYIELVLHMSAGSGIYGQSPPKKRPRVQCDNRDIAERVCQQINYAQALFEETQYTVLCYPDNFNP